MAETGRGVNHAGSAMTRRWAVVCAVAATACGSPVRADHERRAANERFFLQSTVSPGLLVPLYVYPSDVARNEHWNRLIDLKREYPRVPVCAIVNPASGPGEKIDANYTLGISRLRSAGIVTLGYVSTSYASIDAPIVRRDVDRWQSMYPLVHGIFFDETTSQPDGGNVEHYVSLTEHAHEQGFWPVFANPGTLIHEDYFARSAADVFVVHEGAQMPSDDVLKRLEETPCSQLGILVYGQSSFDEVAARRLAGHARWLYITEDVLDPHPWDLVSRHCDALLQALSR
jgi:hypothetical protein